VRRTSADAADELYAAPLDAFVEERKRLAAEAKAAGDKAAGAAIAKLGKPTISAWVVNRLWRRARADMDRLLAIGARMREGEFAAVAEQRSALSTLRKRAAEILTEGGHKVADATLSRVQTTLQALSATGWLSGEEGRLVADRDPPGFEVMTEGAVKIAAPSPATKHDIAKKKPSRRGCAGRRRRSRREGAQGRRSRRCPPGRRGCRCARTRA
jgi:hypothetical protein